MSECEHATNYYVEQNAPVFKLGGRTVVTYRCNKCHKQIYREKPWERWKELVWSELAEAAV